MNPKPLVIYHGNCADGFGAAWVVRKYYIELMNKAFDQPHSMQNPDMPDFFPGVYQTPPPDCTGRDVIIVDFSYKRAIMDNIWEECNSLIWIDHHQSALEDLKDFPYNASVKYFNKLTSIDHSGAMLTWQYYFGSQPVPQIIQHIEDRDLWKFLLKGTKEIQANIFSYPYDFEVWDSLAEYLEDKDTKALFISAGEGILRKHFKDIREFTEVSLRWMTIGGVEMPVINVPYMWGSDACHILAEEAVNSCAAYYYDTAVGRIFGLRSVGRRDVAVIAQVYGGGGHKHAAGFKVTPAQALDIEMNSLSNDWGRYYNDKFSF